MENAPENPSSADFSSLENSRVPANKGRTYPAEPLTPVEVSRLFGVCSRRSSTGLRNRALIALLYRGGLRCQEALDVYPKDLDVDAGVLRVLEGKGKKPRTIGLDAGTLDILAAWMLARGKLGHNGRQPLICTLDGKPLASAYVRSLLPRLAKKAGIEKRVHAHGMRHTYASELRAEGVEVGLISKLLGHSSIVTTARYLDHVNPQAAIDAAKNRKWEP